MFSDRILRTTRAAAAVRDGQRDWFRFENKGAEADVQIYNEIGFFGITASDFLGELAKVSASTLNVHINSPGGDVFDGIAIFNGLKNHKATVNVTVDGIAASIASVIAMAGDKVTMCKGSMMMIHEPFALVVGDAADMRKQADALDLMGNSIAAIYQSRAGGAADYWRGLMAAETWFGDMAAVDAGLADTCTGQQAAKNTFDLSIFRNAPRGADAASTPTAAVPEDRPKAEPVMPDWRIAARRKVATAQMEVIHGYGH